MKTVRIKSYAKVNLTLELVGAEDGYHLLDSLVASVGLFDYIVLKKRKDRLSSVTMHGLGSESIPPEKNNALKAAERFSEFFGVTGADITVFKNIPIGAGLGGSSADISGVLRGMAQLYGIEDKAAIKALALELGSDTAYMLRGGFMRMQGRGERLTEVSAKEKLHFLLLCPPVGVSAGECYRGYDEAPNTGSGNQTEKCINALRLGDINGVGRYLTNDLYKPASKLCCEVKTAMEEALSFSPLGAVMTGSGSCVLALFESGELCEWAKSRYRGKFRAIVTQTVLPDYEKKKKSLLKNPFALSDEEIKAAREQAEE